MMPGQPVLNPPRAVQGIVQKLEGAGFEAWCVGGAVRDALLGHEHLDWDIATSATPEEVQRIFKRVIPVGIEFGTVGVLDSAGTMHEVTTFRKDVEHDGRHARVVFGVSLEDDLARRDFTINALAWSPTREQLFDPFEGQSDLARGLLRTVGDPDQRMAEDRLRALRALRFASRFGFEIEKATWDAIVRSTPFMGRLSPERIRQEMEKTMDQVLRPSTAFSLWRDSGAFAHVVPVLAGASDLQLSYTDFLPRPGLSRRPARRINRIIALFLGAQAERVHGALRDLRFSNSDVAWIAGQAERWAREAPILEEALASGARPAPAMLRHWISRVGRTRAPGLLRVMAAVWCARGAAGASAPEAGVARSLYRDVVRSAFSGAVALGDLVVTGNDLREVGIPPGPRVGRILEALLAVVLDDPSMNKRDVLLRIAGDMAQQEAQPGDPRGKPTR